MYRTSFYISFLAILFIGALGCKKTAYLEVSTKFRLTSLKIDTSTCILEPDSPLVYNYKIFSVTPNGLYCGYNEIDHQIHLYSLLSKKLVRKFELKHKNSDGKKRPLVFGIYIQSQDSIFILDKNYITLYTSYGKVLKQISINTNEEYFESHYLYDVDEGSSFSFDRAENTLYVPTINPLIGTKYPGHFEFSFITECYLNNYQSFKEIPIKWSELYLNNYYGFLVDPQFSLINSEGQKKSYTTLL